MISNTEGTERLYLSKKADETIYIDNCKIPQYHIDGLRFLYRQYKKKKPGVIINDSTGFSRNLQTVLFIKAMRHLLKQPVLILCQEGAEHGWMELFQTWADMCDDVVLESNKPHIKKQVLINTMANLSSFCSRNWSFLVVDVPEIDKPALQVFGLPFKADYKVWITPINMTENLEDFTKIYKWLYPKGEFDKKQFTPDRNDLRDVVHKAILLDAFIEDIVARNLDVQTNEVIPKRKSPLPKISLKNKDATGTKIKRSKRKIYDDDDDDIPLSKTKKDQSKSPESTTTSKLNYNDRLCEDREITDDLSIDNLKRKSKRSDEHSLSDKEDSDTGINTDSQSTQNKLKLFYEPDSPTDMNSDRLYEMDTLALDNNTCDEGSFKVNESVNDIIEVTKNNDIEQYENVSEDNKLVIDDDTTNEIDFNIQEESENNIKNNEMFIESPSIFEIKSNNDEVIQEDVELESKSICNELKPNDNELVNIESQSVSDEVTPDIDANNKISDEVQIITNHNELHDRNNSISADPPTNTLKRNFIEDKMKELEEKAMKKYKGSFLDTLF